MSHHMSLVGHWIVIGSGRAVCAGALLLIVTVPSHSIEASSQAQPVAAEQKRRAPEVVTMDSASVRMNAVKKVMPQYPPSSLRANAAGVAVAEIEVGANGHMASVEILQAPDQHIAASVRSALMQWQFNPMVVQGFTGNPRVRSKLTFYFRAEKGVGHVSEPEAAAAEQAGNVLRPSSALRRIDRAQLEQLRRSEKVLLIDPRRRSEYVAGHTDGALNIPTDELSARARKELASSSYLVVDCLPGSRCATAAGLLRELGYERVALLVK